VALDMREDLSELSSSGRMDNWGAVPVGWPELEGRRGPVTSVASVRWDGQRRVRMIGYMMDGYRATRDGAHVDLFILLSEAGQFMHPAHRIPNQMVEVRPRRPVVFQYRELVWASGTLTRTIGSSAGEKAAYAMSDADVDPAKEPDIAKWFHP